MSISEYSIFAVPENPNRFEVSYFYYLQTPRKKKRFETYEEAKKAFDKMKKPVNWLLHIRKSDNSYSLIRSGV